MKLQNLVNNQISNSISKTIEKTRGSIFELGSVVKLGLFIGTLTSVVGCSNVPYAIIDGSQSKVTDVDSHNLLVTGIDGKMYFDSATVKNVEPGERTIRLASTRISARGKRVSYKDIKLDAKPCKRYVVAAKHDKNKRFTNRYWEVEILRIEDIPWCRHSAEADSTSERS